MDSAIEVSVPIRDQIALDLDARLLPRIPRALAALQNLGRQLDKHSRTNQIASNSPASLASEQSASRVSMEFSRSPSDSFPSSVDEPDYSGTAVELAEVVEGIVESAQVKDLNSAISLNTGELRPEVDEIGPWSRMDAALPFLGQLPLDALRRLVDETACSISALQLPGTEVRVLLDDVSLSVFTQTAAEIGVNCMPAEFILRRPLDRVVRPLSTLSMGTIGPDELSPELFALVRQHTPGDWSGLGGIYLGDVLEWPGGSLGLAKDLLATVIRQALIALRGRDYPFHSFGLLSSRGETSPSDADLIRAIRIIATWATANAGNLSIVNALLLVKESRAIPPEVAVARELLVSADARTLASEHQLAEYDPRAAMGRVLGLLGPRKTRVLLARPLALLPPLTLQEVCNREEVSRERIRQIEADGMIQLRKALSLPRNQSVSTLAQMFAARFGAAAPQSSLLEVCPDVLGIDVGMLSEEAICARLLLWVAGPYEIRNGWLVHLEYENLVRQTISTLNEVVAAGPTSLAQALSVIGTLNVIPEHRDRWLEHLPGFRNIEGQLVNWSGTLLDKVEIILRLKGEPLTKKQLAEAIGSSSPRAIGTRLDDPRFMRSSLKHIALREWGLEEYTGIEEEIEQEIERRGGEAQIDDLVEVLPANFGVSGTAVRMYANGPKFIPTTRGAIRNRTKDDPLPTAPPIHQTKRCYCMSQGWSIRLIVNQEMLRGSGTPIQIGFAVHIGVGFQESKPLSSPFGNISVGWSSMQAWIGSLRRVIEGLDAQVGDSLFVEYIPGEEFQFTLVREAELKSAAPTERLALEVGTNVDRWNGNVLAALGHALGLGIGSESITVLRHELLLRKEDDLVALLDNLKPELQDDQSMVDMMEYVLRGPSA